MKHDELTLFEHASVVVTMTDGTKHRGHFMLASGEGHYHVGSSA